MTLRITAVNAFETSISNLQRRQQDLTDSQDRLTSGKRVAVASDDPVAAARAERALAQMVRSEADQRALEASRNSMQQAETALGDAGELLQQARELILSGGNGSYDATNRQTLADALKGIRDQLLSVANRSDGAGSYIFGGQGSAAPPFVDGPGGVSYQGTGGQTTVPSGETLPMSLDGQRAWLQAPHSDPTQPDLSVFNVLDTAISRLADDALAGDAVKTAVTEGVRDLDSVANHLLAVRTTAGQTLNRQDSVENRISASKLAAQTERSNAEDLDMVEALSEFQNKQSGYDAALKTYSMVQRLSLFQYLSA